MIKGFLRFARRVVILAVLAIIVMAISDYFTHRVANDSVLKVVLDGEVLERGHAGVLGAIGGGDYTALNLVRKAIQRAATDSRISGMALEVIDPEMQLAQAQEIAGLIGDFKNHGKWTTAYIESAGESSSGNLPYLAASACGEVSMMPLGELNLVGIQMRELFARGALDWAGVVPNFHSIGEYKSAANLFTEKEFTAAQREQDESLIDSLFEQLVAQIAKQRGISPQGVTALVDRAPMNSDAGLKSHLLDRVEYGDEFEERVKKWGGGSHKLIDYDVYVRPRMLSGFASGDRVAVVYGSGEIQRGSSDIDPLSAGAEAMDSDDMSDAFEQAREDDTVRAVVFRVDSPGGSVVASELIRRQVELTAKQKPVVISMSGYAASGGYWISTPAAKIFADGGTITGSIGVLGGKFNIAPMAAKLGVNSEAVSRGANVSMFDQFTNFSPSQQALFEAQLNDAYQRFVNLVAKSRHLSFEETDSIAQGRVWTGMQALHLKLIDQIGDFNAALKEARAEAKLAPEEKVRLLELPREPGLIEKLLSGQLVAHTVVNPAIRSALAPMRDLVHAAIAARRGLIQSYCPRVPLM
ncbi:MAG TPA: signal peptide peptidase SppA [Candidatus Binataceae bacterium]